MLSLLAACSPALTPPWPPHAALLPRGPAHPLADPLLSLRLAFPPPPSPTPRHSRASASAPSHRLRPLAPPRAAAARCSSTTPRPADAPLPRAVRPITAAVFVQMLGEGLAISTLPLHLTAMGASPTQVGLATSAFSAAQMVCCPLIVGLSSRLGRLAVLKACLGGATASSLLIASSSSTLLVILGRGLAGVFAASVPVAQAAVADLVGAEQVGLALSRVSAASQAGVIVGPAAAAIAAAAFAAAGLPPHLRIRAVFAASAALALLLLAATAAAPPPPPPPPPPRAEGRRRAQPAAERSAADSAAAAVRLAQPVLRLIALTVGWSLTLSVSTYCLFGAAQMGYGQPELSACVSAGAMVTVLAQLVLFPALLRRAGAHAACALGLAVLGLAMAGLSLCRSQPYHTAFYLLNRAASGVADTATATLVAAFSASNAARASNLALIQSTRAAARIVTPVLSGRLFAASCGAAFAPGALPYLANAALALSVTSLPLVLRRISRREGGQGGEPARREE